MLEAVKNDLVDIFTDVEPPFSGSISDWAHQNIILPETYAQPGKLDLSTSPWLIPPLEDINDPKVRMIVKIMGIRVGKSMLDEITIPYLISQRPSPILRVHQDDEMAATITDTKLIPILQSTKAVSGLLPKTKGGMIKKGLIRLPHMYIRISGDKETIAHSLGIRYLIMDEAHLFEFGLIEKFIGRTIDFAGRRKIVISSTPNQAGSELFKYYNSGIIFEWHWQCPSCKRYEPYRWRQQRNDNTWAGFNWDTVKIGETEHTDIIKSAKTTWLECFHCKHQIHDNVTNRRMLNDNGKYICVKSDGDPEVHAYTVPLFVNLNLSFESFTIQYLTAKQTQRRTTLDEDVITFVNQVLAKFYMADPESDYSKIRRGDYIPNPTDYEKEWVNIMTVDHQAIGRIKYYVIRAWNKKGDESRRLAFGVCKDWEEIEEVRKKWKVRVGCVGVDSGFDTTSVYQECIKHNEEFYDAVAKKNRFITWIPLKGDGAKLSYIHEDGKGGKISKYYAPISKQDPVFPQGSKYKGRVANLVLWSNYSIKSILANLRDAKVDGVKWFVDVKDAEYERQMYNEGLRTEIDKKTGVKKSKWVQIGDDNHYLDCEAMNLVLAIRFNVFSATKVDETELEKVIPKPVS